jgi:hypothetical protein
VILEHERSAQLSHAGFTQIVADARDNAVLDEDAVVDEGDVAWTKELAIATLRRVQDDVVALPFIRARETLTIGAATR